MRQLKASSFKRSSNVYWVTSMEAADSLWLAVLALDEEAVVEYDRRVRRGVAVPECYPWMDTWGSLMEEWIHRWSRGSVMGDTRGDKKRAGCAVPEALSEELLAVWDHVRGTLLVLDRSRTLAFPSHHIHISLTAPLGA
jgi:hypothetical protein